MFHTNETFTILFLVCKWWVCEMFLKLILCLCMFQIGNNSEGKKKKTSQEQNYKSATKCYKYATGTIGAFVEIVLTLYICIREHSKRTSVFFQLFGPPKRCFYASLFLSHIYVVVATFLLFAKKRTCFMDAPPIWNVSTVHP